MLGYGVTRQALSLGVNEVALDVVSASRIPTSIRPATNYGIAAARVPDSFNRCRLEELPSRRGP
jgi:hypothetical protein